MAENVNMQQTEYDKALESLIALHAQIINDNNQTITQILNLSSIEGAFYIEKVSIKIQSLMNTLRQEPLKNLTELFLDTEVALGMFMKSVIEVDIVKG